MHKLKLEGKIALVTGGGKGIGKDICLCLAENGADVVVNYCKSKRGAEGVVKMIKALERRAIAIKADVSQKEFVNRMIDQVMDTFGKIDILVNNAGIAPYSSFLDLPEDVWDNTIDVNLKAVYLCSQRVAREMIKQKIRGKIINISSVGGFLAQKGLAHYNASKGGLNNMTKSMCLELTPYGINVNTIAPGAVEVSRNRASLRASSYKRKWKYIIPLGRWGQPKEIGKIVVFLASDDSEYISGQVICADGGQSIQVPQPEYEYDKWENSRKKR